MPSLVTEEIDYDPPKLTQEYVCSEHKRNNVNIPVDQTRTQIPRPITQLALLPTPQPVQDCAIEGELAQRGDASAIILLCSSKVMG